MKTSALTQAGLDRLHQASLTFKGFNSEVYR